MADPRLLNAGQAKPSQCPDNCFEDGIEEDFPNCFLDYLEEETSKKLFIPVVHASLKSDNESESSDSSSSSSTVRKTVSIADNHDAESATLRSESCSHGTGLNFAQTSSDEETSAANIPNSFPLAAEGHGDGRMGAGEIFRSPDAAVVEMNNFRFGTENVPLYNEVAKRVDERATVGVDTDVPISADRRPQSSGDSQAQGSSPEQRCVVKTESSCCRICQEGGSQEALISPCYCTGTVGKLHMSCLETWLKITHRSECELCSYSFPVERIPQPITKFFLSPSRNNEFANLICDFTCFLILTPLLVMTTALCIRGVYYYDAQGKLGSMFAVVTLIASLIAVYVSWAVLAFLYHYRIWLIWRESSAEIRMCRDKITDVDKKGRPPPKAKTISSLGSSTVPGVVSVSVQTPDGETKKVLSGTSLIFKPVLKCHGSVKPVNRPI